MIVDFEMVIRRIVDETIAGARPMVAEVVRDELDRREQDRFLDARALAELLGVSTAALRMRLRRGSDLAALAVIVDGRRVWRRADVLAAPRPGDRGRGVAR